MSVTCQLLNELVLDVSTGGRSIRLTDADLLSLNALAIWSGTECRLGFPLLQELSEVFGGIRPMYIYDLIQVSDCILLFTGYSIGYECQTPPNDVLRCYDTDKARICLRNLNSIAGMREVTTGAQASILKNYPNLTDLVSGPDLTSAPQEFLQQYGATLSELELEGLRDSMELMKQRYEQILQELRRHREVRVNRHCLPPHTSHFSSHIASVAC